MQRTTTSIGLLITLFILSGITPVFGDDTDVALQKIKACSKEVITEINKLCEEVETIRTVAQAIDSLDSFYALVSRFVNEIKTINAELGPTADTKKLFANIGEIKKLTQEAGQNYGAALGKLPKAILESNDFIDALKKLHALGF